MRSLDLPTEEKGQILALVGQHVLAEARVLVEIRDLAVNPFTDLARNIERLTDAEDLPHLFAALAESRTGESGDMFGIEVILDGIEARLQRRQRDA